MHRKLLVFVGYLALLVGLSSRADAERVYTDEWKKLVESKYGSPPAIEYLNSPVMVDNRDGTISVAA